MASAPRESERLCALSSTSKVKIRGIPESHQNLRGKHVVMGYLHQQTEKTWPCRSICLVRAQRARPKAILRESERNFTIFRSGFGKQSRRITPALTAGGSALIVMGQRIRA
jgi:hypothetical protein